MFFSNFVFLFSFGSSFIFILILQNIHSGIKIVETILKSPLILMFFLKLKLYLTRYHDGLLDLLKNSNPLNPLCLSCSICLILNP